MLVDLNPLAGEVSTPPMVIVYHYNRVTIVNKLLQSGCIVVTNCDKRVTNVTKSYNMQAMVTKSYNIA